MCSQEKLLPLVIGGSVGNLKLVEKLVERGHEVTVATPLYAPKEPIEQKYHIRCAPFSPFYIDRYIPFRERKYILYAFFFFFHLMRLLVTRRFDAVVVRNCVLAAPCWVAMRVVRIPFFLSMTDFLSGFSYQNPQVPRWLVGILFRIERWLGGRFTRTFVITPRMKALLQAGGRPDPRIVVAYDGVDTELFDARRVTREECERARTAMGFERDIVLYHGAVQPDAVDLFEAAIRTTLRKGNANFVIIGMGEGYATLKSALLGEARVNFLGFIRHEEMPRFIAASSVGIIPYKRTFNSDIILTLKILEYLSMGLPVVSTGLASVQEVFGGLEAVRIASDAEEFGAAIDECLRRGPSAEAARLIRERFSWDTVTTRMVTEMEGASSRR